jgi:phage protein D
MALLRPAYRLTIGDHVVDTTAEPRASTVVEIVVRLDMDTPADEVTVVQGQVGGLRAVTGDDVSIDLGYADPGGGLARVLTGTVVAVEPDLRTVRIVGHSRAGALLRARVDRTFEDTTAGGVVRALAGEAGVDVARVEDGPAIHAYVVDGRRAASRHVRDLAALAGFDTYATPDGGLVFEALTGNRTVHVLTYGEHVLEAELARARPQAGTVLVFGESPGASRGDESWAWLTKDFTPHRGSAGAGDPTLLLERPGLRTARAAATAAAATADALAAASLRGRVRIQGRPQVVLGDLVRLERFPERSGVDELDGNYQVRGVVHRLTKADGFLTDVELRSLVGAAAASTAPGGAA